MSSLSYLLKPPQFLYRAKQASLCLHQYSQQKAALQKQRTWLPKNTQEQIAERTLQYSRFKSSFEFLDRGFNLRLERVINNFLFADCFENLWVAALGEGDQFGFETPHSFDRHIIDQAVGTCVEYEHLFFDRHRD